MATQKPRVQAYIPVDLSDQLKAWRLEHGLSESQAITQIIRLFFTNQSYLAPSRVEGVALPALVEDLKILKYQLQHLQDVQGSTTTRLDQHQEALTSLRQSLEAGYESIGVSLSNLQAQIDELREPHCDYFDAARATASNGISSSEHYDAVFTTTDGPPTPTLASTSHFQPGDWVKYYSKGRNLVEQVIEVTPTDRGIDMLLLPNGQVVNGYPELDRFPSTMVTRYLGESLDED